MNKFSRLWGTALCLVVCHSAYGREEVKPSGTENRAVWQKLEKQFSEYVTLRHDGINTENSTSGTITTVKNPHLVLHRPSQSNQNLSQALQAFPPFEAYVDGTVIIEESAKHDILKITPKGSIHLLGAKQNDKPPFHVVVTGDIVNTIEGDFSNVQGNIEQSAWWISSLEALKAYRWQVKSLQASVLTPEPKTILSIDSASSAYVYTPLSKTQQEITLTLSDIQEFIYSSPLDTDLARNKFIAFSVPDIGKINDTYQMKIKMPSWKELFDSISEASQHDSPLTYYAQNSFPELSINGDSQHNSNLMKGDSKGTLTFTKSDGKPHTWNLTVNGSYQNSLEAMEKGRNNFVKKFSESSAQGDSTKTLSSTDQIVDTLVKSEGFLKLLRLIPAQFNTDLNLGFQHEAQKSPFEDPKVDFTYSFMTGSKAGLKIDGHFKEKFNGALDLYNKRLVVESIGQVYNTIGEIIKSFDPDTNFMPVTDLQMQQLQQLLQSYSDTPNKDNKDITLSAKQVDQDTVMIGGKNSEDFMKELAAIFIAPQPPAKEIPQEKGETSQNP